MCFSTTLPSIHLTSYRQKWFLKKIKIYRWHSDFSSKFRCDKCSSRMSLRGTKVQCEHKNSLSAFLQKNLFYLQTCRHTSATKMKSFRVGCNCARIMQKMHTQWASLAPSAYHNGICLRFSEYFSNLAIEKVKKHLLMLRDPRPPNYML